MLQKLRITRIKSMKTMLNVYKTVRPTLKSDLISYHLKIIESIYKNCLNAGCPICTCLSHIKLCIILCIPISKLN